MSDKKKKIKWDFKSIINDSTIVYLYLNKYCFTEKMEWNKILKEHIPFRTMLYKWDHFKITGKYKTIINEDNDFEWRYDFEINDLIIRNINFTQMKTYLKENHFQASRGVAHISNVLSQYCNTIPIIKIEPYCGFMPEGWRLPGEYNFRPKEGNIKVNLNKVKEMVELETTEEKAIKYFKQIYEMTKISNKGIIFSYFVIAPFLHAYKQIHLAMPQLAFGGIGDTGKSIITQVGCEKFWNIPIESANSTKTESRLMGIASGSTFPIGIDDAEKMGRNLSDIMKTHATIDEKFTRKNNKQQIEISTIMLAAIMLNFNLLPKYLKDPANRDRLIYIEPEILDEDKDSFYKIKLNKIPNGYIGRQIIEFTKDWNIDTLEEVLLQFDVDKYLGSRSKNIARIILFGGHLIKEFFKIEVDLLDLNDILEISKSVGMDQLFDSIKHMAMRGLERDHTKQFRPTDWVRLKTKTKCLKKEDLYGLLIGTMEKTQLLRQYDSEDVSKDMSMRIFFKMISIKWKKCIFKKIIYDGITTNYIFVPSEYIVNENIDLNDWKEIQKQLKDDDELEELEKEVENTFKEKKDNDLDEYMEYFD